MQTTLSPKLWDLFKTYIEFNTSLESGENYLRACELLKDYLSLYGFDGQIIEIPEKLAGNKNRFNLIARKAINKNRPTILFYNHIDTVPADYIDAFKFKIIDGKIFGRGACDHKGSTMAVLSALSKVSSPKFNLIFIATTDEETDQKEQLKYLASILKLPKNTIVFDPDTEYGAVTIGHLGFVQFDLLVKGKSTHSAISHMGVNAVEKTEKIIKFLLRVKKEYESINSKYKTFEAMGLKRPCNRLNINMIKGGIAPNVVPDKCTLTIDCRYIPEKNVAKEKIKLFQMIGRFCHKAKIEYEITRTITIEGYVSQHPAIDKLNHIYQKITKEKSGKFVVMGSTDVSEWTKNLKLAHFGIGVMREDTNIHGVNEFCYVKDIENLSLTIEEFLRGQEELK